MNDAEEEVIVVNERDEPLGLGAKLATHEKGILHRAFSIYVFNADGKLLLQKRAQGKYHSGGLLTNTCCGHPRDGESNESAAHRRLQEEMGFDCPLTEIPSTIYKADLGNGMTEHEFLHVYIGSHSEDPTPDPKEAEGFVWVALDKFERDMKEHPERYTEWLKICWPHVSKNLPHQ